jgi:hypothetical protein
VALEVTLQPLGDGQADHGGSRPAGAPFRTFALERQTLHWLHYDEMAEEEAESARLEREHLARRSSEVVRR